MGGNWNDVHETAHTADETGNDQCGITVFLNVDTQRFSSLRILTAGTHSKTESRLVEDNVGNDENRQTDEVGDVGSREEHFAKYRNISQKRDLFDQEIIVYR